MSMSDSKMEEYLQQGMYGAKETNPDERRKFLGTLRERIEIALTRGQLMEKEIYPEVEQAMKRCPQTELLLNGHVDYRFLSKYIKKANKYRIPYRIVTNKEHNSEIGLILTHSDAIDKEEIFIKKKINLPEPIKKEKKGLFSFFKKSK